MEFVVGWLLLAVLVALLADSRGRSGVGFFFLSALLSPLLGLIVVLVTKNPKDEAEKEALRRENHERELESIKAIAAAAAKPAAPALGPQPATSVADELQKLAKLRDSGILTDGEFAVQKERLLSSPAASAP